MEESEEEFVLSDTMMSILKQSSRLRQCLADPRLQTVIRELDASTDRRAELLRLRAKNPWFDEFITSMMLETGAYSKGDSGDVYFEL